MTKPKHNIFRDGEIHVLSRECDTCIFRPHERPVAGARVAEMVSETMKEDGATVVCHSTLLEKPKLNAICRGWYDRLADKDNMLILAKQLDIIVEDEPPIKKGITNGQHDRDVRGAREQTQAPE